MEAVRRRDDDRVEIALVEHRLEIVESRAAEVRGDRFGARELGVEHGDEFAQSLGWRSPAHG